MQSDSEVTNVISWSYWVLTRQGGTLTLYRDGVQIGQRTDLPATATANITGYIADQNNGLYYLSGGIDDVAVYASALTRSEERRVGKAGRSRWSPDPYNR